MYIENQETSRSDTKRYFTVVPEMNAQNETKPSNDPPLPINDKNTNPVDDELGEINQVK